MREIHLRVSDACATIDMVLEPAYGMYCRATRCQAFHSSRHDQVAMDIEASSSRHGRTYGIHAKEGRHTSTVTSSLFVKLPLSVHVQVPKATFAPCSQRVYNEPDPTQPIQLSWQENVTCANCAMRNTPKLPRTAFYTFSLFPWSQELFVRFFLLFSLSPSNPKYISVCSEERLVGFGGSIPHMSKKRIAEMQLAERSHWRLYALAVRS